MKTIRDDRDIDIESNEIHKALYSASSINAMVLAFMVPRSGTEEEKAEKIKQLLKTCVAQILDTLEEAGYSIVKNEVPAAFR